MAYTITTLNNNATVVGTSGADIGATATLANTLEKVTVNAFQGSDDLTTASNLEESTFGFGGGQDDFLLGGTLTESSATLGDGADTFGTAANATTEITIGGQGGSDTFTLAGASTDSRFAGGQGADNFLVTGILTTSTIVGGSEADFFDVDSASTGLFLNGQIGDGIIDIDGDLVDNSATIRGGSENDTITYAADSDGIGFFGDKGADSITDGIGDNTLNGGDGADTLNGAAGEDTIVAGGGADKIQYDTATDAGAGAAITFANIKADASISGISAELITEFTTGVDKFRMEDTVFTAEAAADAGTLADADVATGTAGVVYFVYGTYNAGADIFNIGAGSDTLVSLSVDGGAFMAAANEAVVVKGTNIVAGDFEFFS